MLHNNVSVLNSLKKYQPFYEHHGANAEVNDHVMIKDAVSSVFFPKEATKKSEENGNIGGWRIVLRHFAIILFRF